MREAWCRSGLRTQRQAATKQIAERFNGSFRYDFSDAYLFESLSEVREVAWLSRLYYNHERPHESPGHLSPSIYGQKLEAFTSGSRTDGEVDKVILLTRRYNTGPTVYILVPVRLRLNSEYATIAMDEPKMFGAKG